MSETERKPVIGEAFFTTASTLLILNLLWLVTSLPLITAADASASMYYMMLKVVRGTEDGLVKPFFRFFRKNFFASLPYTFLMLGTGVVILSLFFMLGGGSSALALGLTAALTLIAVTILGWMIPLFAQFDNTFGRTLSNAVNLALQNPPATARIAVLNVFLFFLFLFAPGVFGYVLYLWLVIGHAIVCRIICKTLVPVFNELMPPTEPEAADEEITDDEE